jgi:ribosome recycling factor
MIKDILADAEARMKSALHVLEEDLKGMRTGRASTALVEKLHVEYYGNPTPLYQMANLSVADGQTISIRPFDKGTLSLIEKAISASDLGLTPHNDGTAIRLNIPPLTAERRKDLVKQVHKRLEDSKVAVRNIRRSALHDIHEFLKEKMISEDESKQGEEHAQKLTDKYIAQVEETGKRKEQEIMDF